MGPLVQSLLGHICELVAATDIAGSSCGELLAAIEGLRAVASSAHPPQPQLVEGVARLGKAFTNIVDYLLAQQIKVKYHLKSFRPNPFNLYCLVVREIRVFM